MNWLDVSFSVLNAVAGSVIVAEALNKLERLDLFGTCGGEGFLCRLVAFAGWFAVAIGGGGAVILPFLERVPRSVHDLCAMVGFALLIVHTRLLESRVIKGACHESE